MNDGDDDEIDDAVADDDDDEEEEDTNTTAQTSKHTPWRDVKFVKIIPQAIFWGKKYHQISEFRKLKLSE